MQEGENHAAHGQYLTCKQQLGVFSAFFAELHVHLLQKWGSSKKDRQSMDNIYPFLPSWSVQITEKRARGMKRFELLFKSVVSCLFMPLQYNILNTHKRVKLLLHRWTQVTEKETAELFHSHLLGYVPVFLKTDTTLKRETSHKPTHFSYDCKCACYKLQSLNMHFDRPSTKSSEPVPTSPWVCIRMGKRKLQAARRAHWVHK